MDITSNFSSFLIEYSLYIVCATLIILILLELLSKFYSQRIDDIGSYSQNHDNSDARFSECGPPYPNGWLPVLESRALKTNQVKPVFAFGNDLVAFRGLSGNVYIMDAFCPHLGANLGVGGTVIGEQIMCPFHGWKFNNEGKCTEVPGIESNNIPKAQLKVWNSLEVNGFICVWHHSQGEEPNWSIEPLKEIENKEFVYIGRYEHTAHCHVQEIMENTSDSVHFNVVHNVPEFLGTPLHKAPFYDLILKYIYIDYDLSFKTSDDPHKPVMTYNSVYNAGPIKLRSYVTEHLYGPLLGHLKAKIFGKVYFHSFSGVISKGPYEQRIIGHFYAERYNMISYIIAFYVRIFYRLQVDRDVDIWNNKKFLKNPILVKNEANIKTFRRWFRQYYPD